MRGLQDLQLLRPLREARRDVRRVQKVAIASLKQTFVHCAELMLDDGADSAAPGGAETLALCGSWDHAGSCRWPHHTQANWDGSRRELRVVFAADTDEEDAVRSKIVEALEGGHCTGPDGDREPLVACRQRCRSTYR